MLRSQLKDSDYQRLLARIVPIILDKGLKSATMDSVAKALGMSKRTLYEIFDSKSEMIKEALSAIERQSHEFVTETFANSQNVMEAFITVFKHNRDLIGKVNVNFYRDMDRLYKDKRKDYERYRQSRNEKMVQMFKKGVDQGMFRPDVDYYVQTRIMGLEMEALKRIEELFPPDIDLLRVFDSIIIGFLRSIASQEGMKVLDKLTASLEK